MYHKLKIFSISLLILLAISISAMATNVSGWKAASGNLVQGKIYLASTGTTSVTFTVYFYDSYGSTGVSTPPLTFFLGSFLNGTSGAYNKLTPTYTVTDADANGNTYFTKTYTVSIDPTKVGSLKIDLFWGDNSAFPYLFIASGYQVTNSSTVITGEAVFNRYSTTGNVTLFSGTVLSTNDNVPLLTVNQALYSQNGAYQLILQSDGNLVLYRVADHVVMWTSDTNGTSVQYVFFQSDGNLVLTSDAAHSNVIWAANIYAISGFGPAANAKYVLQDDGNLVMMIDSKYTNIPLPGYYTVLGDTGSGNNSVSPHFHVIN